MPLFDLVPDGSMVTALTVAVLWSSWRRLDRFEGFGKATGRRFPLHAVSAAKALLALLWFMAYCFSAALSGDFYFFVYKKTLF